MVKKSGSIDLTCHLDPAVFVPPCVFNATEKCADCYEGLDTPAGEVNVRFIALPGHCERAEGRVSGEKSGSTDLICRLDLALFVPPCVFNTTEKCADCYEGLTTPTDEVNLRFIALPGLCERAEGRVSGEKAGRLT